MAINRLILAGNLGRDPELREVGDTNVCSFSLPLTSVRKGEKATAWFTVNAWGKLGEVCQEHLSKGSPVVVDGLLQVREYQKDGETRQVLEIRATDVQFAGPRPERQAEPTGGDGDENENEGLPF